MSSLVDEPPSQNIPNTNLQTSYFMQSLNYTRGWVV